MLLFDNVPLSVVSIVVWGITIIVTLIVEAETAELVSIWFTVGAISALICAVCETPIYIQALVFSLVSVILIILTRPLVKKFNLKNTIPTNSDKLIGMTGVVTKEIPVDGKGEIKVSYQDWSAISNTKKLIPVGSEVVIKEITGNKLVVEPIEEIEIK